MNKYIKTIAIGILVACEDGSTGQLFECRIQVESYIAANDAFLRGPLDTELAQLTRDAWSTLNSCLDRSCPDESELLALDTLINACRGSQQ